VYSDTVVSRLYEGLSIPNGFDKYLLHEMHGMNKRSQLTKYTPDAKKMWAT